MKHLCKRRALAIPLLLLIGGCGKSVPGPSVPGSSALAAKACLSSVGGLDVQQATTQQMQAAFASGALSSEQLVSLYLQRIETFDRNGAALNSVRALAPTALDQARAADAARKSGPRKSVLDGIPVLLKDNIGTTDMPTTAGSIALANNIPKSEAFITRRLRAAGAIVLGKANLSEFANWVDLSMPNGYSSLGGQVIAPYDFNADPLGSSTGSAVAAAMALTAVAIGSETSGSIISPSQVHSVVGLKPTLGLVSRSGIIPLAHSFDTAGPIARNITDAAALLGVIAGLDAADDASAAFDGEVPDYLGALSDSALKGARLGVREGDIGGNALFDAALAVLVAQGAEIVTIPEPLPTLSTVSLAEIGAIFNEFKWYLNKYLAEEAGPGLPVATLADIIAFNREHPEQVKYGQNLLQISDAQTGLAVDPVYLATRNAAVIGSQTWIDTVMAQYALDAIVGPDSANTSVTAAAGYPNLTVPMGFTGLAPHGLAFAGGAFSEAKLLAFGYDYEQASLLRVPPTDLNPDLSDFCPAP